MSWSIVNLVNTVEVPSKCVRELFDKQEYDGQIWYSKDSVVCNGKLVFNPDHLEHMDYVNNKNVLGVLKKYKVKGEICFGSLEGDNKGSFWGYSFDGKGNVKKLEGKIQWIESRNF